MVRVKHCALLIFYCSYQLLSISLAAPQNSWRADHDTHKLPGNVNQQQYQQQQHQHHVHHAQQQQHQHQVQQQQQHQVQHQQQQHHYQSVTPAAIDNVYYMGVDSNNAVNVAAVNVATENYNNNNDADSVDVQARDYFTANRMEKPRLLEQSDKRFDDGHYEYSYTLSNGDTRYERAYWMPTGSDIILARKGYYSYPIPNNKYYTVFYTSDQNGFQQDSSAYSNSRPTLPRTVNVPEQTVNGVSQHPNNIHGQPGVVSDVSHNHHNFVPQSVGHWNSPDNTNVNDVSYNNRGEFKRVRRHTNEQKIEKSADETHTVSTTHRPQVQLPRTTETPVVTSERLQQAVPQPAVQLPRIEDIASHAQKQVPVYSQHPNVQSNTGQRDPTYNRQNYQNEPFGHRQTVPVGGAYAVPNQINTLNRQSGGQTEFNVLNPLDGPILEQRQTSTQPQVPQQPQQTQTVEQQIWNQNALLNYLASRLSAESSESYSQESHELFLPGLLGGNNQIAGILGGAQGTTGGVINALPSTLGVGPLTRRRLRGNNPIWPLQQQDLTQRFY